MMSGKRKGIMERKNWVHSGTLKQQPSKREIAHSRLVREMAAEGRVLLKNEGLLPLKESTSIVARHIPFSYSDTAVTFGKLSQ